MKRRVIHWCAAACMAGLVQGCGISDYSGFCDMYVANESGHAVEFEVYDGYYGRNPTTVTVADGARVKVCSYDEMGYAYVDPQHVFKDTVVFRFDDGTVLTCTGTMHDGGRVGWPYSPADNNVLDRQSWAVTTGMKNRHCPLETGVYTLTSAEHGAATECLTISRGGEACRYDGCADSLRAATPPREAGIYAPWGNNHIH